MNNEDALNLSAALGYDVRRRQPARTTAHLDTKRRLEAAAKEDQSAEGQLKLLLRETLERNRAFVAGMAFGVPAGVAVQYVDAIVDDLARVLGPLIEVEQSAALPSTSHNHDPDSTDGGLEYARLYGVYRDGCEFDGDQQHP